LERRVQELRNKTGSLLVAGRKYEEKKKRSYL